MEKKKLPGWVKVLIVLAILGAGFSVVASIGLRMLAGVITSKGGEKIAEKGLEKLLEQGLKQAGGGNANVDISEKGIVIKNPEGGQELAVQAGGQLPAGFPQDVPIFSPSQAQGSMVMGPMTIVTLESGSSLAEITSFYQKELPAKGWAQAFSASPTPENFSGIYRKENRQLTLTLTGEGGKTSIALTYGMERL